MLELKIHGTELFDSATNEFIVTKDVNLKLEHSLISVSKWESKYKKPFLSSEKKTREEMIYYVRCMSLSPIADERVFNSFTKKDWDKIDSYINDTMTATYFTEKEGKGHVKKEVITSELIYYWMVAGEVPIECEKWHINRLLTLLRIISIKNEEAKNPKKIPKSKITSTNAALNAARRKQLNTKG